MRLPFIHYVDQKGGMRSSGMAILAAVGTLGLLSSAALGQSWTCGSPCTTAGPVGIGTPSPAEGLEVDATPSNSIVNVAGFFNQLNSLSATGYGAAVLMGLNSSEYYAKIASIFESENPNFLKPALGFFTMYNTADAGSETEKLRLHASGGLSLGNAYTGTDPGAGSMIISGSVGIGTTAPVFPLQVNNSFLSSIGLSGGAVGATTYELMQGITGVNNGGFSLYDVTNSATRFAVTPSGRVGIRTPSPNNLLSVAGTIGAQEIVVVSSGADYVFEPGYRLAPLGEVADYIAANHHLPEIPSAAEVVEKGVGLGEMQSKLLAKIEELTLHMIQAEERDDRLERENRELQKRVVQLEESEAGAK